VRKRLRVERSKGGNATPTKRRHIMNPNQNQGDAGAAANPGAIKETTQTTRTPGQPEKVETTKTVEKTDGTQQQDAGAAQQ
jgi:hypothetical protein